MSEGIKRENEELKKKIGDMRIENAALRYHLRNVYDTAQKALIEIGIDGFLKGRDGEDGRGK